MLNDMYGNVHHAIYLPRVYKNGKWQAHVHNETTMYGLNAKTYLTLILLILCIHVFGGGKNNALFL